MYMEEVYIMSPNEAKKSKWSEIKAQIVVSRCIGSTKKHQKSIEELQYSYIIKNVTAPIYS